MKIHHDLSESRIKSGQLPPRLGYLGQQWYEIYVCKKIEAGIHAAEGRRVVPHESVKKRFLKQ